MEQRELGRTKEKIPALGIGTWQLGANHETAINAIKEGLNLDMRFVDTAEMYHTEEIVGRAIKGEEVFLATKVSPEHFHYQDVKKACDASLKRLGVRQIDLYQLHWPNRRVPISETMRAMEELVKEGKIRYIGVSNFSIEDINEANSCLKNNEIVSNQVQYSLAAREIEKGLADFCKKERITIIAYSPLARGSILGNGHDMTDVLNVIGQRHGKSAAQVALNWVASKDNMIAIPKAGSEQHMRENARSLDFRLEKKDIEELESFFRDYVNRAFSEWGKEFAKSNSAFLGKLVSFRERIRQRKKD
jgi:hypothetical protein